MPVRAARVQPGHHREERLVVDLARQTEQLGAAPEPHAARLAGVQVVGRELLHVVGAGLRALQRRHPNRHRTTRPDPCTRLSLTP